MRLNLIYIDQEPEIICFKVNPLVLSVKVNQFWYESTTKKKPAVVYQAISFKVMSSYLKETVVTIAIFWCT